MDDEIADREALRREIHGKYRDVAVDPERRFDFYTGRALAHRLGYPHSIVDPLPEHAVEYFAGVSNPFSLRRLRRGEKVVDVGSGAGFDAFIAAGQVGDQGRVVGIDMTPEMITKSRASADALGLRQVEFREGLAEALPIEDDWAASSSPTAPSISAPTRGRCSPRSTACCGPAERCNSPTSPAGARCRPRLCAISTCGPLESRAGCPRAGWQKMLEDSGFTSVTVGPLVDNFGGTAGEEQARAFDVYGYTFLAFKRAVAESSVTCR